MKPLHKPSHWQIAFILLLTCFGAQATCQLSKLNLRSGNEQISIGALSLGEADNPELPTAWQGPLKIDQCTLDVGLIEQPLIVGDGRYLIVSLYSGSTRQFVMVDPKTCSIQWKNMPFTAPPEVDSNSLRIDGVRLEFDEACMPKRSLNYAPSNK